MRILFLLLLSLLLTPNTIAHSYTPEAYERLERTVVIEADLGEDVWLPIGTGFTIKKNDGYRLYTSRHIAQVRDVRKLRYCSTIEPSSCEELGLDYVGMSSWVLNARPYSDWAMWPLDRLVFGVKPARLSKRQVRIGEPVCTVGTPNGIRGEYTCGAVTNIVDDTIVMDARVLPGNSGGAVWNEKGRVIGIVSAIDVPSSLQIPVPTRGFITPVQAFDLE